MVLLLTSKALTAGCPPSPTNSSLSTYFKVQLVWGTLGGVGVGVGVAVGVGVGVGEPPPPSRSSSATAVQGLPLTSDKARSRTYCAGLELHSTCFSETVL